MEHLNYCRQMVRQFSDAIAAPGFPAANRAILRNAIDLSLASAKFLLPAGGRLYDDPEFRALDETQELHLPHPFIALEYSSPQPPKFTGDVWPTKQIVFARECDDVIVITPVMWVSNGGHQLWVPLPECAIPRVRYLARDAKRIHGLSLDANIREYVGIMLYRSEQYVSDSDYANEVGALLCFLNVLQCGNVHVERSEPKNHGKRIKTALPFDTYHVLTIDVPRKARDCDAGADSYHRSPREHLRRGHIRRLADGRRVWVNATVVAAGRGAGVVSKDYRLRGASQGSHPTD